MVDKLVGNRLNVGIETIGSFEALPQQMPSQSEARLTGEPIPQQLDALFPENSVEHLMRDFAKPEVSDPSVLLPTRFEALIRQATSEFQNQSAGSSSPALDGAADVLERHGELTKLLHRNRATLLTA